MEYQILPDDMRKRYNTYVEKCFLGDSLLKIKKDGLESKTSARKLIALNQYLQLYENGWKLANPDDIEDIIRNDYIDLKGKQTDLAILIDDYLSIKGNELIPLYKSVSSYIKENNIVCSSAYPLLIPFNQMTIKKKDKQSNLEIGLINNPDINNTRTFGTLNYNKFFSHIDNGMPILDTESNRYISVSGKGVMKLYLDEELNYKAQKGIGSIPENHPSLIILSRD